MQKRKKNDNDDDDEDEDETLRQPKQQKLTSFSSFSSSSSSSSSSSFSSSLASKEEESAIAIKEGGGGGGGVEVEKVYVLWKYNANESTEQQILAITRRKFVDLPMHETRSQYNIIPCTTLNLYVQRENTLNNNLQCLEVVLQGTNNSHLYVFNVVWKRRRRSTTNFFACDAGGGGEGKKQKIRREEEEEEAEDEEVFGITFLSSSENAIIDRANQSYEQYHNKGDCLVCRCSGSDDQNEGGSETCLLEMKKQLFPMKEEELREFTFNRSHRSIETCTFRTKKVPILVPFPSFSSGHHNEEKKKQESDPNCEEAPKNDLFFSDPNDTFDVYNAKRIMISNQHVPLPPTPEDHMFSIPIKAAITIRPPTGNKRTVSSPPSPLDTKIEKHEDAKEEEEKEGGDDGGDRKQEVVVVEETKKNKKKRIIAFREGRMCDMCSVDSNTCFWPFVGQTCITCFMEDLKQKERNARHEKNEKVDWLWWKEGDHPVVGTAFCFCCGHLEEEASKNMRKCEKCETRIGECCTALDLLCENTEGVEKGEGPAVCKKCFLFLCEHCHVEPIPRLPCSNGSSKNDTNRLPYTLYAEPYPYCQHCNDIFSPSPSLAHEPFLFMLEKWFMHKLKYTPPPASPRAIRLAKYKSVRSRDVPLPPLYEQNTGSSSGYAFSFVTKVRGQKKYTVTTEGGSAHYHGDSPENHKQNYVEHCETLFDVLLELRTYANACDGGESLELIDYETFEKYWNSEQNPTDLAEVRQAVEKKLTSIEEKE